MGMAGGHPTVGRPQIRPRGIGRRHRLTKGEGCLTDGTSLFPAGQRKLERLWLARTCAQGRGRLGQFLRGILRSGHQHQKVPVGVFALHAVAPQLPGQLLAGHPRGGRPLSPAGGRWTPPASPLRPAFPEAPPGGLQFPPGAGDTPPPGTGCTNPRTPALNKRGWWSQTAPGRIWPWRPAAPGRQGRCR